MIHMLNDMNQQGNMDTFCYDSAKIWQVIGFVINIFKIAIPIIIVLLAILDLGKAVMAGEDKEIQAAQKMLVKRLAYGVAIFFVVTIVQVIMNLISSNWNTSAGQICWQCGTSPNGVCRGYVECVERGDSFDTCATNTP